MPNSGGRGFCLRRPNGKTGGRNGSRRLLRRIGLDHVAVEKPQMPERRGLHPFSILRERAHVAVWLAHDRARHGGLYKEFLHDDPSSGCFAATFSRKERRIYCGGLQVSVRLGSGRVPVACVDAGGVTVEMTPRKAGGV